MQKKMIKNLFLAVVMVVLCLAVGVTASAETWGDYEYILLEDGTVEITEYFGGAGELIIPSEIDSKPVTSIGNYAFRGRNDLTGELIIPEEVVKIGAFAFEDCSGFTGELSIPNSVTNIGFYAFLRCDNISKIFISDNVEKIETYAFGSCQGVFVSENNKNYSSDDCGVLFNKDKTLLIQFPSESNINDYAIPESVKSIGYAAFASAYNLETVHLPEGLLVIEENAFYDCISLKELYLPGSLQRVDSPCFSGLFTLEKLTISENLDLADGIFLFGSMYLDEIYVKSMTTYVSNTCNFSFENLTKEKFKELYIDAYYYGDEEAQAELMRYAILYDDDIFISKIYCHAGSIAETYAIENGMKYELTHFYEGEWIYDAENKYCYRKCIHCNEREISKDIGDIEIEAPVNPDTDFTVDVVEDYVIIEETISNNVTNDFEIIKAFDINLKNKDGVHVQPDGIVKVKLPLDWSKDGMYKVYRVNDDGTLTDMNAYRQGSHMVFETDHFSIYVIVDESEKADEPTETPDEPKEEKDNLFSKIFDLIKSFFDLILSWFKK